MQVARRCFDLCYHSRETENLVVKLMEKCRTDPRIHKDDIERINKHIQKTQYNEFKMLQEEIKERFVR